MLAFPKNPTIAKFFIQLGRVDELGSGVINVTRLVKQYSGKAAPQFIEGHVFKTVIPLPGAGLNEGLKSILNLLENFPGIQAKDISIKLGDRPLKTVERQIKSLTEAYRIERRGSKKTGGYWLTKRRTDGID